MKLQNKKLVASKLQAFADDSDEEGPCSSNPEEGLEQASHHLAQGQRHAEAGEFGQALQSFEKALSLQPPDAHQLYELRAQVLMQLGRDFDAIQAAAKATSLAPYWAPGFLTLGRAQLNYGEPRLALASFQKVLALQPDNPDAQAELGVVQMLALQQEQAGAGRRAVVGSTDV